MARPRRRPRLLRLLFLGGVLWLGVYLFWLPDVRPLKRSHPHTSAFMELRKEQAAARGKTLKLRWQWVPWERISPHLRHAVLVAEDDMFYRHDGVDWEAVKVAFDRNLERRRFAYGGSTITQQLARNLYLSPSKNPLRKVKEYFIARRLERELGKRRIFELYLNLAEWGPGVFGCEAAARHHFGKSAAELSLDEALALSVVLPNPIRYDPAKAGRYVQRNMRRILARMQAGGMAPLPAPALEPSLSTAPAGAPGLPTEEPGLSTAPVEAPGLPAEAPQPLTELAAEPLEPAEPMPRELPPEAFEGPQER